MSATESLRDEVAAVIEDAFCVISGSGRTCEIHEERTEGGRCPRALSAADALLASPALDRMVREARALGWDVGYLRGTLDATSDLDPADNPYRDPEVTP